jgi:hypothetical protein
MASRPQSFLEFSAALTGFSQVLLRGTGMSETYLHEIDTIVPPRMLDAILAAFQHSPDNHEGSAVEEILGDPELGPVARNIALLWYCGTWTALPDSWRARYGAAVADTTHVVSAAAYQAGLQWSVVGAHPAGARQQGFGAWAVEPENIAS